ncbi:MAG: hypothetical protein ACREC4_02185 [Methylocella sp.]
MQPGEMPIDRALDLGVAGLFATVRPGARHLDDPAAPCASSPRLPSRPKGGALGLDRSDRRRHGFRSWANGAIPPPRRRPSEAMEELRERVRAALRRAQESAIADRTALANQRGEAATIFLRAALRRLSAPELAEGKGI